MWKHYCAGWKAPLPALGPDIQYFLLNKHENPTELKINNYLTYLNLHLKGWANKIWNKNIVLAKE